MHFNLKSKFPIFNSICSKTFENYVGRKYTMNYSRKRLIKSTYNSDIVNSPEHKLSVIKFAEQFFTYFLEGFSFIFIDEAGFKISLGSYYGYSRRGQKTKQNLRRVTCKKLNLVAAISDNGFSGGIITEDNVNGDYFYHFIFSLINENQLNLQKTVFVIDNLSLHKSVWSSNL